MGRELEYNEKSRTSRKNTLSGKLNAKITPLRVFRIVRADVYAILCR